MFDSMKKLQEKSGLRPSAVIICVLVAVVLALVLKFNSTHCEPDNDEVRVMLIHKAIASLLTNQVEAIFVDSESNAPAKIIKYKNEEEFKEINRNCCSVQDYSAENLKLTRWEKLNGKCAFVKINYKLRYTDRSFATKEVNVSKYVLFDHQNNIQE